MGTEKAAVDGVFTVTGFSFGGRGQSSGLAFVRSQALVAAARREEPRPGHRRPRHGRVHAISRTRWPSPSCRPRCSSSATPPASTSSCSTAATSATRRSWTRATSSSAWRRRSRSSSPCAPTASTTSRSTTSTIDREKASAYGLTIADINNTLSAAWGSGYVNDFLDRGRVKRVFIQGDDDFAHAAGGFQQMVRAQQRRARWCPSPPSPRASGPTARPSWSATTACPPWKSSASPRPASAPARP